MRQGLAVGVEGIGKRYQIGAAVHHTTLRDHLAHLAGAPARRIRGHGRGAPKPEFWALRNVSLDVEPGEVLGIVGRNGAGKTTLLKILSRITEPTEGTIEIRGRVGSLLEVGTGFHGELTGRENIFLNGAILGMRKSEIERKFNDIVEFAEIGEFLDTPVKRYSSGMYVRLAFAVAAHLEPEIMIVDEVLAVGDTAFQKKCIGKMGEVARSGRTVLFVSHNMGAVADLCTRAVLLEKGQKIADGSVADVIGEYSRVVGLGQEGGGHVVFEAKPELDCQILSVSVRGESGVPDLAFSIAEPIEIAIEYEVRRPFVDLVISINLARNMVDVLHTYDTDALTPIPAKEPGRYVAVHRLPPMFLKAGVYTITPAAGTPHKCYDLIDGAIHFQIEEFAGNTNVRGYRKDRPGSIVSPGMWTTDVVEPAQSLSA